MKLKLRKHEQEAINIIVRDVLKAGFRVFLAEAGNYGFFTDEEGSRVVSFQYNLLSPSYSGNYITSKPRMTGTGWRITEGHHPRMIHEYFNASPPRWAVIDAEWRYATMEDHLNRYGDSSKYEEVFKPNEEIGATQ